MARTQPALVNAAMLVWARSQIGMPTSVAASKAATNEDTLASWESSDAYPTMRQARLLAGAYRVPLAAFFLEKPPAVKTHLPKDLRRIAGAELHGLSSTLQIDVRDSWQKREIALELLEAKNVAPPTFGFSTKLNADPETTGSNLRFVLKATLEDQRSWRDGRRAFNAWRSLAEAAGVLVFQTSDLTLDEVRAYSLYAKALPVVVVNRKDVPVARVFSLLHELVHLGLHSEGICDLSTALDRRPEDQRLEVFCNAVAAAALLPRNAILSQPIIQAGKGSPRWENHQIEQLARSFSVSREALLRRLLTLKLTTEEFYKQKRDEYSKEYASQPAKKGFILPPADVVSLYGKPYVRLVLDGLNAGGLTTSDASDYLGLRLKHLPTLSASLEADNA